MINPGDFFRLPKDFKPYGIQLLFYLLFSDHHEVWASHEKLANILGFSRRTVIRTVAHLEGLGILSVKRFQRSVEVNRYRLNLDFLSSFLSQISVGAASPKEVPFQGSSSEDPLLPADSAHVPPPSPDSAEFLLAPLPVSQDDSPDLAGEEDGSDPESVINPVDGTNQPSESYFGDPRLDLLVEQIEQGRKDGTRLFQWLKSQNILTYWPPTDSYGVEKEMLRSLVKTLDELNAILTAPVKPQYQWFVASFLEEGRDNGYDVSDTSDALALEINMFLDNILKPESRQGKSQWTVSSLKAQLRMMIQEWEKLPTWKQLRLSVEPPPEPTLEFFVTHQVVWQAAREKWIEEREAETLKFLERFESGGQDMRSTAASAR